jgi:hypothetical protein
MSTKNSMFQEIATRQEATNPGMKPALVADNCRRSPRGQLRTPFDELPWKDQAAKRCLRASYSACRCVPLQNISILRAGRPNQVKEASVYAAIRQGKARAGMAEELARRIKEGAIPIISDVEGFKAYYVVYAPDDTVTAISIFNDFAGAEESNRRALTWIEQNLAPLLVGPATALAGPVIVHTLA